MRHLLAAAASAAALAASALAAPVAFTLDGVVFGDGTTATGSFVFDPETGEFGDIEITTQSAGGIAGATYTVAADGTGDLVIGAPGGDFQFFDFTTEAGADSAGDTFLSLVVFDQVDDLGGRFALQLAEEIRCENAGCTFATTLRSGFSGALVGAAAPVPLPPAAALMGAGLIALGGARRRR